MLESALLSNFERGGDCWELDFLFFFFGEGAFGHFFFLITFVSPERQLFNFSVFPSKGKQRIVLWPPLTWNRSNDITIPSLDGNAAVVLKIKDMSKPTMSQPSIIYN